MSAASAATAAATTAATTTAAAVAAASSDHVVPPPRPRVGAVELADNSTEEKKFDELANLYAIIKATEALEGAYSRDLIPSKEYTAECEALIRQFKTTEAALLASGEITSSEAFVREYNVGCPRAVERLMRIGTPATTLYSSRDQRGEIVIVAETVQEFITCMDAVQLEQRAVDELQPALSKVTASLARVPGLPADFEGRVKLKLWLEKLHGMRAEYEISEIEARQLKLDLENAYSAFHAFIKTSSGGDGTGVGGGGGGPGR